MCRHVVYWGPPTQVSGVLLDGPHSLLAQCTRAREMAWGEDNLDGWGLVWTDDVGRPQRYRTGSALTHDESGRERLRELVSGRFLGHVRQKTPGSLTDVRNTAPFGDRAGRFFSHNGYVNGFRDGVREQLIGKLSPERAAALEGDTDSEVLFALVLDQLDGGAAPSEATRIIADVAEQYGGRFNIVLWCNDAVVATRWENSLYTKDQDGGVVLSSEPLDDGAWHSVPERSMVTVDRDGVRLEDW